MLELNKIYCMDCLEGMKQIDDNSVDMILCDLPYGTTACSWDTIIPFDKLWKQYKRILKKKGIIVLFSTQPFTTKLVSSNSDNFKYCYVWNKRKPGAFNIGKYRPLQITEDICVFAFCNMKEYNYYPIMEKREKKITSKNYSTTGIYKTGFGRKIKDIKFIYTHKYPKNILNFSNANQNNRLHPTQKPVKLFEYLIKTYTKEWDLVLDNCIGSGTTAVACKKTNRNFIGIEKEQKYVNIANKRLYQNTLLEVKSANSSQQ